MKSRSAPTAPRRLNAEAWLQSHSSWVALALVAAALALRIAIALPRFLNPDEISNLVTAYHPTLAAVLNEALHSPHPPLYFIFLYCWRMLGGSDFWLRLPSILAGVVALWFAYRWLRTAFNGAVGIAGLVVLGFAPMFSYLMIEIRQYPFLFLVLAAALLEFERSLSEQSPRRMILYSLLMVLALFVHSSAFWYVVALGIYGLALLVGRRLRGRTSLAWTGGQVVAALLAAVQYLTQYRAIQQTHTAQFAVDEWLKDSYFHRGIDSMFLFPLRQTLALFQYLFSHKVAGPVLLAVFVAGLVLIAVGRKAKDERRWTVTLLILPFLVIGAASMLGLYPYGGSRHDSLLLLFIAAPFGIAVAAALRNRILPVVALACVLVPLWFLKATPTSDQPPRDSQQRRLILDAADFIRESTPPGRIVFTDDLSQFLLRRYLCRDMAGRSHSTEAGFTEFTSGSWRLVASMRFFTFPPDSFGDEFARMASTYGLGRGDTVCVVSAGWGLNIAMRLFNRYRLQYPGTRMFGRNIAVLQLPVGEEPSTARLAGHQARAEQALIALTRTVPPGARFRTILWPTGFFADSIRRIAGSLSDQVMSYAELYKAAKEGAPLDRYLPALAFWELHTAESHPEFMRYMEDAENYVSGGYRFTLALLSPDTTAAAYVIEPAGGESASPIKH